MTDIDYTHNPYGKLAAEEQAIKTALNTQLVKKSVEDIILDAQDALDHAGITDRTVKVQLWVSDPEGCGLTIVSPS